MKVVDGNFIYTAQRNSLKGIDDIPMACYALGVKHLIEKWERSRPTSIYRGGKQVIFKTNVVCRPCDASGTLKKGLMIWLDEQLKNRPSCTFVNPNKYIYIVTDSSKLTEAQR